MYKAVTEVIQGNTYICDEIRSVVNELIQAHMPEYSYKTAM
jgi:hypothetical protein